MSKCLKCGAELPAAGDCPSCAAEAKAPARPPALLSRELPLDRRSAFRAQGSFQLGPPEPRTPVPAAAPPGFTRPVATPAVPVAPTQKGAARHFTLPGTPPAKVSPPAATPPEARPWEPSPLERILAGAAPPQPVAVAPPGAARTSNTWPFATAAVPPPPRPSAPTAGGLPPSLRTTQPGAAAPGLLPRAPLATPAGARPPGGGSHAPLHPGLPPAWPSKPMGSGFAHTGPSAPPAAEVPRPTAAGGAALEPRRSREVQLGLPPAEEAIPATHAPLLPEVPLPGDAEAPRAPGLTPAAWERTDPQYPRPPAAMAPQPAPGRLPSPAGGGKTSPGLPTGVASTAAAAARTTAAALPTMAAPVAPPAAARASGASGVPPLGAPRPTPAAAQPSAAMPA
ncbi:MAG: hypothetical protein ACLQDQ_00585, partial [Myxococcaceae bacterium]